MITIIADSGSTKTDWALLDSQNVNQQDEIVRYSTQGINPIHQSDDVIRQVLLLELLPNLCGKSVDRVYFYGSGVRPEKEAPMVQLLSEAFPNAVVVEAHSDLLGAARALCAHNEGVACILGTGANSCLYDGERIVMNTPALGYIIGDEGSGAALGKRLIRGLYGGSMGNGLVKLFEEETCLTLPMVIDRVYRQPLANRWLASLSEFVSRHLDDVSVRLLVKDNFVDFLSYHVLPYDRKDLTVSFVGSVAWFYQDQLREAISELQCQVGVILRSPLDGLVRYHCTEA